MRRVYAILAVLAALVAVPVLVAVIWLGPYLRDDMRLDKIVRVVALDWRDFGKEKAQERLQYELDLQAIGPWVNDKDCVLEEVDGEKVVRCAWTARLELPGVEGGWPMDFEAHARVDAAGDLQ